MQPKQLPIVTFLRLLLPLGPCVDLVMAEVQNELYMLNRAQLGLTNINGNNNESYKSSASNSNGKSCMESSTAATSTIGRTDEYQRSGVPPFLTSTYDMVEDISTDRVFSWGNNNTNFVVWLPDDFARDLLPTRFKHCNFSSFVPQLNTYVSHLSLLMFSIIWFFHFPFAGHT